MMVNNDKIERDAVNTIRNSIDETDFLLSDISDTDKYPSLDGSVRVYKDNCFKVENLDGTVNVQVKGKSMDELPSEISFPVKVDDLNVYYRSFGTIYFVVGIYEKNKQIYYLDLLPIRIDRILKKLNKEDQETVSLKFHQFPTDNIEKVTIFKDFLKHQKLQAKVVETGPIDIKVLEDKGLINSYSIPFFVLEKDLENNDPYRFAFSHPGFMYACTDIGNFPINEIAEIKNIIEPHPFEAVKLGKTTYYTGYNKIYYKDYQEVQINENVSLRFEKNNQILYQIKGQGCLTEQLHNFRFALALIKEKVLHLGLQEFVNVSPDIPNTTCTQALKDKQKELNNIYQITELLNITKKLITPLENFSSDDWKTLNILKCGLIDDLPVLPYESSQNKNYIFADFKVSNLYLVTRIFVKDGQYHIQDLYSKILPVSTVATDGSEHWVSPFLFFSEAHFECCCNLNFPVILKDLLKYAEQHLYVHELNNVLLRMLNAYDRQKNKNQELLDAIISLARGMHKYGCFDNYVGFLNFAQAMKRKKTLFTNHKKLLMRIVNSPDTEIVERLGAAILLEDFEQAEMLFKQLSANEQKEFDSYPIANLWKKMVDNNNQ